MRSADEVRLYGLFYFFLVGPLSVKNEVISCSGEERLRGAVHPELSGIARPSLLSLSPSSPSPPPPSLIPPTLSPRFPLSLVTQTVVMLRNVLQRLKSALDCGLKGKPDFQQS